MKKLQQRVDSLKPHVISFRFQEGTSIVDAVFKDGWHVPQSEVILSEKGEAEDLNYHMFYSQDENVGLDEILDYIEKIIGLNIEREKKHALLKIKVKELKDVFRKNPLSKLEGMKFVLTTEKLVAKMEPDELDVTDFDIDTPTPESQPQPAPVQQPQPAPVQQPQPEVVSDTANNETNAVNDAAIDPNVRYAPNGEVIPPLSPQDNGDIEDEFKKYDLTGNDEPVTRQVGAQKIDLPAKKKPAVELAEIEAPTNVVCKCGPEEVCPACEDEKIGSY